MPTKLISLLAIMAFSLASAPLSADSIGGPNHYEEHEITYSGEGYFNEKFRYLLLKPAGLREGETYPLVLFLHGPDQCGDDTKQLLVDFPSLMTGMEYRRKYPCFVLVPQCRKNRKWVDVNLDDEHSQPSADKPTAPMEIAIRILKTTFENQPVDRSRVYLTGLSMGGYGCWDLAVRHPGWFAAVVPICGGGDESRAFDLVNVPIWAVHGEQDTEVPVARSRRMIESLIQAGGNPRYTEYPKTGHDCWTKAYAQRDGVIPWMFKQVKPSEQLELE